MAKRPKKTDVYDTYSQNAYPQDGYGQNGYTQKNYPQDVYAEEPYEAPYESPYEAPYDAPYDAAYEAPYEPPYDASYDDAYADDAYVDDDLPKARVGFRVAAGVLDFLGVMACTLLILGLMSVMTSLYTWLRGDLNATFAGIGQNINDAVGLDTPRSPL